ncbi:unnamed protein product [Arabidopsis lyrata]|nr:unnamed protein product [Arabidopsis lyrata]
MIVQGLIEHVSMDTGSKNVALLSGDGDFSLPLNSLRRYGYKDEKVIAFQDIKPAAQRHYLVIPKEHIPTVNDLQRRDEDYSLVRHMLSVGQELLRKDAPQNIHRFGFHQPPFNSVDHLHLHCFALPYVPRWKAIKYKSLGPLGGFIEAETLLEKIRPLLSKV